MILQIRSTTALVLGFLLNTLKFLWNFPLMSLVFFGLGVACIFLGDEVDKVLGVACIMMGSIEILDSRLGELTKRLDKVEEKESVYRLSDAMLQDVIAPEMLTPTQQLALDAAQEARFRGVEV